MNAQPLSPLPETPMRAAARWLARRRSGTMSAEEMRALEVWLEQDPAHRAAWEHLAQLWGGAETARNDPEVMRMREAAARAQRVRRGRAFTALAATLLVACALGAGFANWVTAGGSASPALVAGPDHQEFRTSVGQTATVTLADGSVVTLDTNSVLRTRTTWNRRYAELARGRAFFRVAHQPTRPFVVLANGRTVTALGTSFEVSVDRGRFEVTLVSGRVRVEQPVEKADGSSATAPTPVILKPGTKVEAPADGAWRVANADIPRETSWVDGLLRFRDTPLGQVAAELNRYSDKKVVIDDPAVSARPIQGAFAAGDVDEFVRAAQSYGLARVTSDSSVEVVLAAPKGAPESPGGAP
jgi:transmembrane sensor